MTTRATTDGLPARPGCEGTAAPAPIDPGTGQHEAYWILSAEERAKGFIRPVRLSYKHVGPAGPRYPLRELTPGQHERYDKVGYVQYEEYPPSEWSLVGRFWTAAQLDAVGSGACGTVTTMGRAIAETYGRDPKFYGSTFCYACGKHFPVGATGEFVWINADGCVTDERVGT